MPPSSANVELHLDGLEEGTYWVMDLEVEEALSEVHPVRVALETRGAPAPDDLLDKPAAVLLELFDTKRRFQGVVVEAALEEFADGWQRLEVVIAPRLALLALG